jgi:hypothetical protein
VKEELHETPPTEPSALPETAARLLRVVSLLVEETRPGRAGRVRMGSHLERDLGLDVACSPRRAGSPPVWSRAAAAAADGGADAAHRARLSDQLFRRHARRRHSGADLSPGAPGADRGPPAPARRILANAEAVLHHHRAASQRRGCPLARRGTDPDRGADPGRNSTAKRCRCFTGRHRRTSLSCNTPRAARATRRASCSATPTCWPTCGPWAGGRGEQRRRLRLLAAALSRHGPDRRLVRLALLRHALVLMSPLAFLAAGALAAGHLAPSRHAVAGAQLCLRAVCPQARRRRLEGLDLSSWRLALNGAEPVSPATLEAFAERFVPHGLQRRGDDPGLWPGRVLGRAGLPAARARPAHRPHRARRTRQAQTGAAGGA